MAIYAVYPCRDYLPEKVNVFIDFLAGLFANEQWARDVPQAVKADALKAKAKAPVGAAQRPLRKGAASLDLPA